MRLCCYQYRGYIYSFTEIDNKYQHLLMEKEHPGISKSLGFNLKEPIDEYRFRDIINEKLGITKR